MPKKAKPVEEVLEASEVESTETVEIPAVEVPKGLYYGGKKLVSTREEDGYVYATDEEGTSYKLHWENGNLVS